MSSAYFAPLVILPDIITEPGKYITRRGETVTIHTVSVRHNFGCEGIYESDGIKDQWHKSGRVMATAESRNDIVARAP